ncbi:MAG TPA: hypothetical protein VGY58_16290 [Gemmataceae bacterium]|jgi:hypothetical protein|nr:hypothetical protein [Gemmataceae bacterium]
MLRNCRGSTRWISFFLACTFAVCLVSCGSKEIKELPPEQIHIRKIASLWGSFKQAHDGKAPANTKEFTDWAKKLKADQLARCGITDINEALVSPRDGQPYEIAPVSPKAHMGMSSVVIYEKVGVNGKHMTASSMGTSAEVADEDLGKVVPKL